MTISASYVNSSRFSISGEHDQEFEAGRRVTLFQADSGNICATVTVAAYDSDEDRTLITVTPLVVESSITAVKRGASSANSVGHHGHTGHGDGGPMPASAFSTNQVTNLSVAGSLVPSYGEVLQGDSGGGWSVGLPATIRAGTAGEALTQYKVVYQDTLDSGKCKLAQYEGLAIEAEACALVLSTSLDTDAEGVFLLHGYLPNSSWSFTPGAILYLGSDGTIVETEPAWGYSVRLGRAWTATEISFFPQSPVYIGSGTT